jgi:hypothetical protein
VTAIEEFNPGASCLAGMADRSHRQGAERQGAERQGAERQGAEREGRFEELPVGDVASANVIMQALVDLALRSRGERSLAVRASRAFDTDVK